MKDKESILVLTPFNLNSILIYHSLKRKGIKISFFFDPSQYLHGDNYDRTPIVNAYFIPNAKVICCANKKNDEIIKMLRARGYAEDNIKLLDSLKDTLYDYKAINDIDYVNLVRLMPRLKTSDELAEFRKNYVLNKIGILDKTDKSLWNGLNRRETWTDVNGDKHLIFRDIDLIVSNKCSLRCKYCTEGMQYSSAYNAEPVEIESVINDYDRILSIIDWVDHVAIIGGEPFLNDRLYELLYHIKKSELAKEKVGKNIIITNGTIIPNDKTIEALKDTNTPVWISNYGKTSKNLVKLVNVFVENEISFKVLDLLYWSDTCQLKQKNKALKQDELVQMRKTGCVSRCHAIIKGRMYLCGLIYTMHRLKLVPEYASESSYVDIYGEKAKKSIYRYVNMDEPLPVACSWCNGCSEKQWNQEHIPAGEQAGMVVPTLKY